VSFFGGKPIVGAPKLRRDMGLNCSMVKLAKVAHAYWWTPNGPNWLLSMVWMWEVHF
jgi:hypothetical protein